VNTHSLAHSAYGRPETPVKSQRSIEYDLFARVTKRMTAAWAARSSDFAGLVRALHDNTTMWRTLASDVAEPENGLPKALRARLFYLYEFTAQHSPKILEEKASVEVLVDINTAVMRGLRGEGSSV
jgi:flagellar biosynthesis activator protein FlaF